MPSPTSKRRRISNDGRSSPAKTTTTPPLPTNVLPSFMTPTKASLAKSYPHLVPKSPARGAPQRVSSPTRQPPRRSIPPEGLPEVVGVPGPSVAGRSFLDNANDRQDIDNRQSKPLTTSTRKPTFATEDDGHSLNEDELEQRKTMLMRRIRQLRAECENLEQQLDQAKQSKQQSLEAQRKTQSNMDATMSLIRFGRS